MRATFLGVSTILMSDDETSVMTDGFFSRPTLLQSLLRPLRPDEAVIDRSLARAGAERLAAVLVAHSHYDHAMDAPLVAQRTGAELVGSGSTRRIAEGYSFPADRFRTIELRKPMCYGNFTVTALPAVHSPNAKFPGMIEHAITPPAWIREYAQGDCFSFHIAHPDGRVLVHASANFVPGALDGYRAETVYLGIGTLGKQSDEFRRAYWDAVVIRTRARRVIPIHWDNFWKPLDQPLTPLPRVADHFRRSMEFLTDRARADGVAVHLPTPWEAIDPFG
ncbi:MAG: MBL fold metallo-hydrolase [Rhodococcus sp. (in: high G+C Gram-positive bacteria)]|uniref:MBL fold metallo-hydrolase n=1 Tax=Rhodococcus sp. TaxID=1831 RepID=UPI003BAFA74C